MDASDDFIRAELVPGERLLWAGRARQGVFMRPIDFMTIPMGCAWSAGTGFAVVLGVRDGSWPLVLGALAFMLPGLYLLFGRIWIDAFQRSRTAYAVTDRRLLFVRRLPRLVVGPQVRSFNLASVAAVTLRERRRGTGGTISFSGQTREDAWAVMSGIPGADDYYLPTFELDQGAREVYSLVLAAQQGDASGLAPEPATPAAAAATAPAGPSLRKRQAMVAAIVVLALAGLLRWEQWQCLDANGNVLAGSGALLWSGQVLDATPIAPPGGRVIVSTTIRLVPPLIQRHAQPVTKILVPPGPRGAAVVPGP